MVEAWTRYLAAVEVHEGGHVAIALDAARAAQEALSKAPQARSVGELDGAVEAQMNEILRAFRRREAGYDEDTRQGAAQGAELPQDDVDTRGSGGEARLFVSAWREPGFVSNEYVEPNGLGAERK